MAANKEEYSFRIAHNLCTRCGVTISPNKKMCQIHLDEASLREKLKREIRKNKSLCTRCGKRSPRYNKNDCQECFEKDRSLYPSKIKLYYNKKNNFKCVRCKIKIKEGAYCNNCKVRMCEKSKALRKNQKRLIIDRYGGKCFCCGEENIKFLTIDHINNDGSIHKRQLKSQKISLYRWIIKNNFPKNVFQIACYNCNCARALNNFICPHQQKLNENPGTISIGVPTQG